jgi:hypothetical protein
MLCDIAGVGGDFDELHVSRRRGVLRIRLDALRFFCGGRLSYGNRCATLQRSASGAEYAPRHRVTCRADRYKLIGIVGAVALARSMISLDTADGAAAAAGSSGMCCG